MTFLRSERDAVTTGQVVRATRLTKRYGLRTALAPLDLHIDAGEFVGLLGVNGSGKSTLVKLIAGVVAPSGGQLEVLGARPGPRSKLLVAYMPEMDNLYLTWRVMDAFRFTSRFFLMNRERFEGLLEFLQVDRRAKFGTLSKGSRTRIRLALTLAREARLYLLDEPLGGIDPPAREQILGEMMRVVPPGAAVVFATHQVGEAEHLFDRVVVLDRGHVLLDGAAAEVRQDAHGINSVLREPVRGENNSASHGVRDDGP